MLLRNQPMQQMRYKFIIKASPNSRTNLFLKLLIQTWEECILQQLRAINFISKELPYNWFFKLQNMWAGTSLNVGSIDFMKYFEGTFLYHIM